MALLGLVGTGRAGPSAKKQAGSLAYTLKLRPPNAETARVAMEEYGIDILRALEVRSFETCTRLDNTPGFDMGLFETPRH